MNAVFVYPVLFGEPFSTPRRDGRIPILRIDQPLDFEGVPLGCLPIYLEGAGLAFFDTEDAAVAELDRHGREVWR